jgi:hypothetical protein
LRHAVEQTARLPDEQQELIAQVIEAMLHPDEQAPKLAPDLGAMLEQIMREYKPMLDSLKDK